jgi:Fic family protein
MPPQGPSLAAFVEQPGNNRTTAVYMAAAGHTVGITTPDGKYRHWHTLRRLKPPGDLTSEEYWLATKVARSGVQRQLPLRAVNGALFTYTLPDEALRMLHHIDSAAHGNISVSEVITNQQTSGRYVISSLIEEAITSSQLEGAVTTRVVAKEMIRSGRAPRDKSERMILNNFRAIRYVGERRHERLTPEFVLDVHRIVTEDTLDDPSKAGTLQTPDDDRARVEDVATGEVFHLPPPAAELPNRLSMMCAFANGETDASQFMHPIVRAILLHLWLAYDHPFEDGNGRTARALFYWSMLHQGYWLAEYLSISKILTTAPVRYGRSFLYVETDDYDSTYFVLAQLKVICRSIDNLTEYLSAKMAEVRALERFVRSSTSFNRRQIDLIGHALRHPLADYTIQQHAMTHGVTHESARLDLADFLRRKLFTRQRIGHAFHFRPVPDFSDRISNAS